MHKVDVGVAAINRMTEGVTVPEILHIRYGYAFVVESHMANPEYADTLVAGTRRSAWLEFGRGGQTGMAHRRYGRCSVTPSR